MLFGGIDDDQYTGNFYELPLITNDFWGTQTTGLYYGGQEIKKYNGNVSQGTMDTGTSLILMP